MFRVMIEEDGDKVNIPKVLDLVIKTEKLYELLGRYMVKMGPPDVLVDSDGITELSFHKIVGAGYISATVGYVRISKGGDMKLKTTPPIVLVPKVVVPDEPPEERLAAMLEHGVIKKW
jgi:hypothetical protein